MSLQETENRFKVYKHTTPDGKVYIGMTGRTLKRRWKSGYGNSGPFAKAIKRFGWENIEHDIIADGLTRAEAEDKERETIALYRSNEEKYGYNLDSGGYAEKKHCERTIRKMSEAAKRGKHAEHLHTREVIECRALSQRGHIVSEETRRKIGDSHRGKKSVSAKSVLQIDMAGNVVRQWDCTMDVEREMGYKNSAISRCCLRKRPTAYGFVWRYANDNA